MAKELLFAPLLRVSTEAQEKKGESLRTQEKMIRQSVEILKGCIPECCWKYSGQERATPGQERNKLDQLLEDSGKGLFDAVIVCDASRWSRDNAKSKQGLKVLRDHGVRFFVGTREYDLSSPSDKLFLGLACEINEFHANEQSMKSILNRIERAKRGIPTGGKVPHGRIFVNEEQGWKLDQEKAASIRWAARQYLSGKSLTEIAKHIGMNMSNLWKILTRRAGDSWEISFDSNNIHEVITMKVPRLLPQQTIDKILERAISNKTYTHGEIKNKYLLSRMVFCEECGYAMFGQTNHGNRRYYRHARHRVKECQSQLWVPAENLEKAVMVQLFEMFGDVKQIEKAARAAVPAKDKLEELEREKDSVEKLLKNIEHKQSRLIDAIADGTISNREVKPKMDALREREGLLVSKLALIKAELNNAPTQERLRYTAQQYAQRLAARYAIRADIATSFISFWKMHYESKRGLVQHAFSGKDAKGQRLGVYVKKDASGELTYSIKGILSESSGTLPMTKEEAQERLRIVNIDYCDDNPLDVPIEEESEAQKTKFTLSSPKQDLP